MAYTVEPLEITKKEKVVETRSKRHQAGKQYKWWEAETPQDLAVQVLSTTEFLKRTNAPRIRQASVFSRLLSGKPLNNYLASNSALDSSNQLPIGRPTANVCYSCTDTLASRMSQDRPKPVFLSNKANYKERHLAEESNDFIQGEFFRVKAYDLLDEITRDALAFGDGLLKVYPQNGKVCVERTLETELLVDANDAYYRNPRQLIQMKLVDRSVMEALFPKAESEIAGAQSGQVDSTPRSTETIADQFIVAEAWHLPSSEDSKDGRHVIVCSEGIILDEPWEKPKFPFVKLGYNFNSVGWFCQGLIEILMPTQMEIYRMLIVASQAIELMGVPRIYIDELSKIAETSFNNRIGTIIKGRGNPPVFLNAQANSPEIYQWVDFLINNSYSISGISQLSAAGKKPAGLDSGEAIRESDELQDARFAAFQRRRQTVAIDLAYMMIDCAKEIADEDGSYMTVYPGKDGTREVDFKNIAKLKDSFVIQCFDESSLPTNPEGRQARLSEMLAAGEITNQEFRRLSNFPDLSQSDQLATALEERILFCLDHIIEYGDKDYQDVAPDPFLLDPTDLATTLCVNYINLYSTQKLEEEKLQVLRNWFDQVQNLKQMAQPPPIMAAPQGASQLPPPQPPQAPVSPISNVAV